MPAPEYRYRPTRRQHRDDAFRLEAGGLEVDVAAGARTIAYDDIAEVRIQWSPASRWTPARGSCLVTPRGGRPVAFSSHSVQPDRHEQHNDAFRRFVDALVRRAAANPATRFTLGLTPGQRRAYVALIAVVALVVALAAAALATGAVNNSAMPLVLAVAVPAAIVAVLGFPPLIRNLRHNPPGSFEPRAPGWRGLWPGRGANG